MPHFLLEDILRVRFKKLIEGAVTPTYAKQGDAGMDMTATSLSITDNYVEYGTGIAVEIPYGYVGLIFPRSSVSKKDLVLCNSVGVVDSGYRGEVKFRFKATSHFPDNIYDVGEKIGQLMILPYPNIELEEAGELSSSERGEGGFGHTNG